jgi:bla regulator protein BlaR1
LQRKSCFWTGYARYFFRKAIRLNQEFLADEAVLTKFNDVKSYQLLLLDTIISRHQTGLTSSFNYSITKKRLAMMTRIKNIKRQYIKQLSVALLSAALTFVFSEKIYAQIEAGSKNMAETLPQVKLIKFKEPAQRQPLVQKTELMFLKPGPGISESQVQELYSSIEKHTSYVTNKKGRVDPVVEMPAKLKDHLYELFTQMNKEQLLAVQDSGIIFLQSPITVKKAPTLKIFENWKRAEIFGIWVNDKHVPNTELNRYKHTDIAEYSLSKLYGAALKGHSYKYQLDLTTNEYFDKTYQQRMNDRVFIARMSWFDKRPKTFKKSAFSLPIQ